MNLIIDNWLTVRTKSGLRKKINPAQITESYTTDPIIALDSPRPDFNASGTQLLIGLYQDFTYETTKVPTLKELERFLSKKTPNFNLDGKGHRFMQDFKPFELDKSKSIHSLLVDGPGDITVKERRAFLTKTGTVEQICPSCAALTLYTLQINAPPCGVGYRTSIRGGSNGYLNTLLLGKTLWETIRLNTLSTFSQFEGKPSGTLYPWTVPTISSIKGKSIKPKDVHYYHFFWEMPWRLHLIFENSKCYCDICDEYSEILVKKARCKNYGNMYKNFHHSLSPYSLEKGKKTYCAVSDKTKNYGVLTSVWTETKTDKTAEVIKHNSSHADKIWVFGFEMNKAKFISFTEEVYPKLTSLGEKLIKATEYTADTVEYSIRKLLIKNPSTIKKANLTYLKQEIYQKTDENFRVYNTKKDTEENLIKWIQFLMLRVADIFEVYTTSFEIKEIVSIRKNFHFRLSQDLPKKFGIEPIEDNYFDFPKPEKKEISLPYIFKQEPAKAILSWWGKLKKKPIDRKIISNYQSTTEVMENPNYWKLFDNLNNLFDIDIEDIETFHTRLAIIVLILPHIESHNGNIHFYQQLKIVNNHRIKNLISMKEIPEYKQILNVVKIIYHVNIPSLATDIINWGDSIRKKWSYSLK